MVLGVLQDVKQADRPCGEVLHPRNNRSWQAVESGSRTISKAWRKFKQWYTSLWSRTVSDTYWSIYILYNIDPYMALYIRSFVIGMQSTPETLAMGIPARYGLQPEVQRFPWSMKMDQPKKLWLQNLQGGKKTLVMSISQWTCSENLRDLIERHVFPRRPVIGNGHVKPISSHWRPRCSQLQPTSHSWRWHPRHTMSCVNWPL